MEKSADFIRKKEFHIVFKGYKPEEVDKFLDILSVEFDRLLKRNRELQDSLDKLKFENTEEDTDIKKVIQDALISAHKVAEDIKAQAKKEADSIIDQRKAVEDRSLHALQMKKLAMESAPMMKPYHWGSMPRERRYSWNWKNTDMVTEARKKTPLRRRKSRDHKRAFDVLFIPVALVIPESHRLTRSLAE